jgi:transketolase N-terminal domain/subunit
LRQPARAADRRGASKAFWLREGLRFQATFTDLPNHPNFAAPLVDVSAATLGTSLSVGWSYDRSL